MKKQITDFLNFKRFVFIIALLLPGLSAFTQQTDFSGTWKLTQRTSLSGADFVNGMPSRIAVIQDKNTITVERTTAADAQSSIVTVATEKLNLNGSAATSVTASKRTKISSLQLTARKTGFTETSALSDPANQKILFNSTEVWSLSVDGITLTIVKNYGSVSNPDDRWSMKGVYQKEQ